MEQRPYIEASEGHVLTDGKNYVRRTYPASGLSADGFYEITEAEYEAIMEAKAAEEDDDEDNPDRATEEDYQQALREMGVSV